VILFYTIVSAQSGVVRLRQTDVLSSEVSRLKEQVLTGRARSGGAARHAGKDAQTRGASATRETNRIVTDLESRKEQLSSYDAQTVARREHIEKLKAGHPPRSRRATKRLESREPRNARPWARR